MFVLFYLLPCCWLGRERGLARGELQCRFLRCQFVVAAGAMGGVPACWLVVIWRGIGVLVCWVLRVLALSYGVSNLAGKVRVNNSDRKKEWAGGGLYDIAYFYTRFHFPFPPTNRSNPAGAG